MQQSLQKQFLRPTLYVYSTLLASSDLAKTFRMQKLQSTINNVIIVKRSKYATVLGRLGYSKSRRKWLV